MVSLEKNFLKTKAQDSPNGRNYSSSLTSLDQSPVKILPDSESPPDNPEDDAVLLDDQEDHTGYYSPVIYKDEEEYYGSPQKREEDDALILFTTSFIEEEVIRKCITEINPDYLRSKAWELKWLAAKVRFRV